MPDVTEITTAEEMDKLRSAWNDLVHRSPSATVFQTWEWISCCLKHFGRGRRLSVIAVTDGGRLLGVAPLELVRIYGSPLRRLQFIGIETSDYMDIIADAECEEVVVKAIFDRLKSDRRWHVVDLQQLPTDSPLLRHVPDGCDILRQEVCPCLPLPAMWGDFMASLGKKTRWNIGYYERRAAKDFDMEIRTLGQEDLGEGMEAFFELHQKRWRQRWLPGTFYSRPMRDFHREVAEALLESGHLRLHGIRLDGRLRAVLYCFAHRRRAYYYLGGFEPELAKYSLGTVLTAYAIRDAIEDGCAEFDFLRGNEPYKARWTRESRTNSRLILRRGGMRSTAAASLIHREHRIQARVKDWLHSRFGNG